MAGHPFSKSGGHSNIDFEIDQIRVRAGAIISFRDRELRQAMLVTGRIVDTYQSMFGVKLQLKALKTDNIPMGVNRGQVLVQIGFQDVYNNEEQMNSAKHFVNMYKQHGLTWLHELILNEFPSIAPNSIKLMGKQV